MKFLFVFMFFFLSLTSSLFSDDVKNCKYQISVEIKLVWIATKEDAGLTGISTFDVEHTALNDIAMVIVNEKLKLYTDLLKIFTSSAGKSSDVTWEDVRSSLISVCTKNP